jgi:dTDP-4-amino-4,6-dideoxygalactose transaminase
MMIPFVDLKAQYETIRDEVNAAVSRVLESTQFVLGPEVGAFESEFAAYCGARHCVAVNSGTSALHVALLAAGVGEGDEVITVSHTFVATAAAIRHAGARPVLVDIDPRTCLIDPSKIEAAITARTRAVMPVHLYGQCAEMDAVTEIARRHNLIVVEDAAQAIGAETAAGRRAGTMSAAGCFSFYPTKNLGAAGDAGLVTTDDDAIAARLRRLRVHGGETEYLHREVGLNSRLDAVQAALLRVKLPHLDSWSDARAARAARYDELFADARLGFELTTPHVGAGARHIFHQYVVRVPAPRRDALMKHLAARGVGTKVYYPVPLHLQECFRTLGYAAGSLPESERAARETFALPLYPELTDEEQRYVVAAVEDFKPQGD